MAHEPLSHRPMKRAERILRLNVKGGEAVEVGVAREFERENVQILQTDC